MSLHVSCRITRNYSCECTHKGKVVLSPTGYIAELLHYMPFNVSDISSISFPVFPALFMRLQYFLSLTPVSIARPNGRNNLNRSEDGCISTRLREPRNVENTHLRIQFSRPRRHGVFMLDSPKQFRKLHHHCTWSPFPTSPLSATPLPWYAPTAYFLCPEILHNCCKKSAETGAFLT